MQVNLLNISFFVTPAKAGVQFIFLKRQQNWIPAFAGMTVVFVVALFFSFSAFAQAQNDSSNDFATYYASLRHDEVNVRGGPGRRFPIEWVYHRRGLPVQVVASHDQWRRVRDFEGTEGWLHQAMLARQRTVLVQHKRQILRWQPDDASAIVAYVAPMAIGNVEECSKTWCKLNFDQATGYMRKTQFWGVPAGEEFE